MVAQHLRLGASQPNDYTVNVRNAPFNATGNGTTDDAPAIQASLNYAWGTNNTHTELNKTVYIPPGIYKLGSTLLVTNVRSARLIGGGKYATILRSDVSGPAIRTDGMWFSEIRSLCFRAGVGGNFGLLELDGNIDHLGNTIGVQGNSITDCYFEGNSLPANGLAITPAGWSYGQGSENRIENCHFISCTNAAIYIYGYNAHNNTIIGGNIQSCPNNGIYIDGATSQNIIGIGFQNATSGWASQIGYDIYTLNTEGSTLNIQGCRTESWKFLYNYGALTRSSVNSCFVRPQGYGSAWSANHSYALNDVVRPTNSVALGYTFKCTTPGLSGNSDPTWNPSVTTTDNAAQWQKLEIVGVRMASGSLRDCRLSGVFGDFQTGQVGTLSIQNCVWDFPGWNLIGLSGSNNTGPDWIGNAFVDVFEHRTTSPQSLFGELYIVGNAVFGSNTFSVSGTNLILNGVTYILTPK